MRSLYRMFVFPRKKEWRYARNNVFVLTNYAYRMREIQLEDGGECQNTAEVIRFQEFTKRTTKVNCHEESQRKTISTKWKIFEME